MLKLPTIKNNYSFFKDKDKESCSQQALNYMFSYNNKRGKENDIFANNRLIP